MLHTARSSSGVSCGSVEALDGSVTEIVVAGGIWYTDKVEIYDVRGGTWRDGGKEIVQRRGSKSPVIGCVNHLKFTQPNPKLFEHSYKL